MLNQIEKLFSFLISLLARSPKSPQPVSPRVDIPHDALEPDGKVRYLEDFKVGCLGPCFYTTGICLDLIANHKDQRKQKVLPSSLASPCLTETTLFWGEVGCCRQQKAYLTLDLPLIPSHSHKLCNNF